MTPEDQETLDAFAKSGYPNRFTAVSDARDGLWVRERYDLAWIAGAAMFTELHQAEQPVCYALGDPWPMKTSPEDLADADALLDLQIANLAAECMTTSGFETTVVRWPLSPPGV